MLSKAQDLKQPRFFLYYNDCGETKHPDLRYFWHLTWALTIDFGANFFQILVFSAKLRTKSKKPNG